MINTVFIKTLNDGWFFVQRIRCIILNKRCNALKLFLLLTMVARWSLLTEGNWKVRVKTSDLHNAGTHAQVYLTVYGSKGTSKPQPLGTGDPNTDEFDQGKESEFTVSWFSLLCTDWMKQHSSESNGVTNCIFLNGFLL